ncbi:MAG TPA: YncE family protein [Sphingomicrobium sp.]|nr:YncE family protein [Sphingomicrobium sp.]
MRVFLLVSSALALALTGCGSGSEGGKAADAQNATRFAIERIALPGDGRGDFITVDAPRDLLFVTHSSKVHILDLASLKQRAEVDGLKATHGVAMDNQSGHAFVTDGERDAVIMFDPARGRTLKTISAGKKPDSILLDPASQKLFAFNGESGDATVIDPSNGSVSGKVKLPSNPESVQADGKGTIWVTMEDADAIAQIDSKAMKFVRSLPLPGCDGPAPLALDQTNHLLFTGCGNKLMMVSDASSGQILTSVPIGGDPDGIIFDAARKRLFVANRDGAWTVIDQQARDRYSVNQSLKIDQYAKTAALDPATHRIFSSTADLVWPKAIPGKKLLPNAKPGTFRLVVVKEL